MGNPYRGKVPGRDMTYMDCLVQRHNMTTSAACTHEIILAICWEEGLFNNGAQDGGSAIGFGQTEPAELDRLNRDGSISVDVAKVRARDDDEGIEAACQVLDYYIRRFGVRDRALRAYAGYDYAGFDRKKFKDVDAWHANRDHIINGWKECEKGLLEIAAYELAPEATMEALKKARGFIPTAETADGRTYREILFPMKYPYG